MAKWIRYRSAFVAAALVFPDPARALPDECSNDVLRAISFPFAQACDLAAALDDQINGKQDLLSSLGDRYDSLNDQFQNSTKMVASLQNNLSNLDSQIKNFRSIIAQENLQINSLTDIRKKWELFQTQIVQQKASYNTALAQALDKISVAINSAQNQIGLIDNIADKLLPELRKLGIDTSLILGTSETPLSLTLNPISGTTWFNATLPNGFQLSTIDIENLIAGKLTIPSFDPIDVMLTQLPVTKTIKSDWR